MNWGIILVYHSIGSPPRNAGMRSRGLYVKTGVFSFQMWYLRAAGFRVVSLKEIVDFACGAQKNLSGRLAALTFDDGYMDFYENAFPVLKRHGYPSTVFLVSGLAGRFNFWDGGEKGCAEHRLLDWQKAAELSAGGVTFGSHTKTHPHLTRIAGSRLKEEILGSRQEVEDKLGMRVDFFCYPYGDYNEEVLREVKEAGFIGATTTRRGLVCMGDDLFELKRMGAGLRTWLLPSMRGILANNAAQSG
ncbi:MAG: polysaccharide deacetylase family protein [Nitrospiraceae bacterium]|nr:polysaccharide deacetylase family protein [Nitrospiraceae bacterium]MDA8089596.1 polysaccharide deacetylase family protein [Nitrospiraceae bacterium]